VKAALWVLAAAVVSLLAFPLVAPVERRAFDARLSIRQDGGWPKDLVLVPVNDASITKLGRWPWPRAQTAQLLTNLRKYGVKTVLVDISFAGASQNDADDAALEAAVGDSVLGIGYVPQGGVPFDRDSLRAAATFPAPVIAQPKPSDHFLTALPRFHAAARGAGHALSRRGDDGLMRGHVPMLSLKDEGGAGLPSLALATWLEHRGIPISDVRIDRTEIVLPGGKRFPLAGGEIFLDMVTSPGAKQAPMMPAHDVLEGKASPMPLQGAMAILYVDSVFTHDEQPSPLGPRTAGGLLHAYAVRTFDSGNAPKPVAPFIPLLACFALVLASLRFTARRPPSHVAIAGAIAAAVYSIIAIVLVPIADLFAPVAWPSLFLVLSGVVIGFRNARIAEVERSRLRGLLDAALSRAHAKTLPEPSTQSPTRLGPTGGAPRVAVEAEEDKKTLPGGPAAGRRYERASAPSGRGSIDSTPLLLTTDELEHPVEVGRYLVQRSLGRGGMGAIFLAIDQELARPVAIKVLHAANDPSAFRRFRQEALAVARLSHPNVVQIYEVGFDAAVPYIVMEYVAGGTCSDLLRDPTVPMPLPWERVSRIVEGVAKGLGAAHAMGIVHRDVKPANLLLVQRDGTESKVADFGIAKLGGGETLTREGSFVGTVGYLSPEQARGKEVKPSSDVYSLGITWYKLLTGFSPYEGSTAEILGAQQHADIPDPREMSPDIPEPVVAVLRQMTARDPNERLQDGAKTAAAIAAVLKPAVVGVARR